MSDRLKELLLRYRKGRDGFDSLVLEVTRLYGSQQLLPPLAAGDERTLAERLEDLTPADVEHALAGKLGTEPMTRAEHASVLEDITAFIKEWLAESD